MKCKNTSQILSLVRVITQITPFYQSSQHLLFYASFLCKRNDNSVLITNFLIQLLVQPTVGCWRAPTVEAQKWDYFQPTVYKRCDFVKVLYLHPPFLSTEEWLDGGNLVLLRSNILPLLPGTKNSEQLFKIVFSNSVKTCKFEPHKSELSANLNQWKLEIKQIKH